MKSCQNGASTVGGSGEVLATVAGCAAQRGKVVLGLAPATLAAGDASGAGAMPVSLVFFF